MSQYSDLLKNGRVYRFIRGLTPITNAQQQELLTQLPGLPSDYCAFLTEIGYGTIGEEHYKLYDGVLPLGELLPSCSDPAAADLLVFGDNFGGSCHGFDPYHGMQVLEIDMHTLEIESAAASFEEFIRALLHSLIKE